MVPAASAPRDEERLAELEQALCPVELVEKVVLLERAPGRRPWAVLVPDLRAVRGAGIVNLWEALRFRCENAAVRLPPGDRPAGVSIARAPLPRDAAGRCDRARLARELGEPPARFWPREPPAGRALPADWAALFARLPETSSHAGPWTTGLSLEADLGLDSLDRLALIVGIGEALAIPPPADGGATLFTLGDLLDFFGERAPGGLGAAERRRRAVLGEPARPTRHRSLVERATWPLVRWGVRPVFSRRNRRRFAPRVIGLERVDWRHRPLIVAQNHQSSLDPVLLADVVGPGIHREMVFLGYAGYFAHGLARWFNPAASLVPIDADAFALRGLRAARRALDAGRILVIYPEGERTWTGALTPFRRGVAWLAATTGAAVVPSAISGAYRAAPRGWPAGSSPVTIAFDAALEPPRSLGDDEVSEFLDALRARIAGMLRELGDDPDLGDPETWASGPASSRRRG